MLTDATLTQEILNGITDIAIPSYQFYFFRTDYRSPTLTLPSQIKYIGDHAFCTGNFTSTTFVCNQNLEIIGNSAFESSNLGIKNIIFNNGLKVIGNGSIKSNQKINSSIIIPDSVEFVGDSAFESCNSIPSVQWSSSCPVIPKSCFNECTALSSVTNLDNVHIIGARAFTSSAITELFLPNINGINQNGIYNCKSLTTLTLGPELGYTNYQWIRYCTSLTTINVIGDENCLTAKTLQATNQDFLNNATIVYNYTPPSENESENDSNDGE